MKKAIASAMVVLLMAGQVAMSQQINEEQDWIEYPDEIMEIREVPVGRLYRVVRMDGNVFWVSGDRRWAFSGELIDLWTGLPEQALESHDVMSWERAGVAPGDVSINANAQAGVVFIGHGEGVPEAVMAAMVGREDIGIAPVASAGTWDGWEWIWCLDERWVEVIEEWARPETQKSAGCRDRRAAVAMAFAQVFGIQGKTPSAIDSQGRIFYGEEKVLEWLSTL